MEINIPSSTSPKALGVILRDRQLQCPTRALSATRMTLQQHAEHSTLLAAGLPSCTAAVKDGPPSSALLHRWGVATKVCSLSNKIAPTAIFP